MDRIMGIVSIKISEFEMFFIIMEMSFRFLCAYLCCGCVHVWMSGRFSILYWGVFP